MRRFFTQILALALLVSLLAGCGSIPEKQADTVSPQPQVPEPAAATEAAASTAAPTPEARPADEAEQPTITWATAFRDESVPEGVLTEDSVAFLHRSSDGTARVFNVPKEEIYSQQPERLPRTRFFEQYMPQELVDELLPALDYAVANGCSRLCIPATSVSYSMIKKTSRYLSYTYDINNESRIDALPIKSFPREDGTLSYLLITIHGLETGNNSERYPEGLAAAQAIVDAMPDGLDEKGKMLYLYQYLTDNVRYDNDNYYGYYGESDWCLLYDALVLHNTVCTGYSEALYVLCNLAGIECFIVSGEVGELLSVGLHAWNVARIDGTYYEFDATWDEGMPPADYQYFGMSTAYSDEYHTRLMRSFDKGFCPPCPDDLLPPAFPLPSEDDPTYPIFWYYRLCNARDAAPERMLEYFGYEKDRINAVEIKDGWFTTGISMAEFFVRLGYMMTPEQMEAFAAVNLQFDVDDKLMFHVPETAPTLLRLVGAEKNVDGSYTASLLEMAPDGSFVPREQRITLKSIFGSWFIDRVE